MAGGINWNLAAQTANVLGGLYGDARAGIEAGYDDAARAALSQNLPQQQNFLQRILGLGQQQPQPQQQPNFLQQIAAPPPAAVQPNAPRFAAPPQTNPMFAGQAAITESQEPPQQQVAQMQPQPMQQANGNLPRGLRNNNALNIEAGPFTQRQAGFQGHDGRFARFQSPEQGIVAASNLLDTYGQRGLNTVNGIINRWAPPSDGNNVNAYAGKVSQVLGVHPNQPLNLQDPQVKAALISAMSAVENGRPDLTPEMALRALTQGQNQQAQLPPNAQPTQMQAPGVQNPQAGMQFTNEQLVRMLQSPRYAQIAQQYIAQQRAQGNADRSYGLDVQRLELQRQQFDRKEDPEKVRLARAAGLTPGTPEWQRFLVGTEQKAPAGYQWVDPTNPSAGLSPIPNGPATHISSEVAGKLALMDAATPGVKAAREVLLKPWGVTGTAQNVAANLPYVGDVSLLSGDIGIAQRDVRTAVEAALRVMTGAAAPEQEVQRYLGLFMPSARDTKKSAEQKLNNLEAFMTNAKKIATQGRVPNMNPAGPQQQTPGVVQEGATATNPQTGQKIQFRNGQWQLAQ